jgi:hypothetical protein
MKNTIRYLAPWLCATAIGGAIALSPIASAAPATPAVAHEKLIADRPTAPVGTSGEDPLVPVGPDPEISPYLGIDGGPGLSETNPAGGVDLPG